MYLPLRGSISISVMSETGNQLGIVAAVPVHPMPMVEDGGILARMEGNRRCDRLHSPSSALTEKR